MAIKRHRGGSAKQTLQGHIDAVLVACGFIEIRGWVCHDDTSPSEPPLAITLNGRTFSGFNVRQREDLVQARIATGMAAFDAILPVAEQPVGAGYAIGVSDASGASCELVCSSDRVSAFMPRGFIDLLDEHYITGWVFDPSFTSKCIPELRLDGELVNTLALTVDRPDLSFDLGNSCKFFGFEAPIDNVRHKMARRGGPQTGKSAMLTLSSSGFDLAAARVLLTEENVVRLE